HPPRASPCEQQSGRRPCAARSNDDGINSHRYASLRNAYAGHRLSDLLRDHPCVVTDSVDETGVAPTLKMQAEHVESDLRGGPTLVRDFAMSIENWDTQPRVRTSVACCPNHRIDALILQIEAVGSRGSMAPGWGE